MAIDIPTSSFSYYPGLWEQDKYTIPLEAAVIGVMNNFYVQPANSVWPFQNESTTHVRKSTRHPGKTYSLFAVGIAATTLGTLEYTYPNFQFWPQVRGWIHAHLVTEMATSFSKQFFLRKRPFYDDEVARENQGLSHVRLDDKYSFFSGHASHAFAFATYASRLIWDNSPLYISLPVAITLHSLAGYVAAARFIDGQHNASDVIAGAAVGSIISFAISRRVNDVIEYRYGNSNQGSLQFEVQPLVAKTKENKVGLGLDITANF